VVEALSKTEGYVTAVHKVWVAQKDRGKAAINVYFNLLTDERNECVCTFKADIEKIIVYWKNGRMPMTAKHLERLMQACISAETDLNVYKGLRLYDSLMELVARFYTELEHQNHPVCSEINGTVTDRFYEKYADIFQRSNIQ